MSNDRYQEIRDAQAQGGGEVVQRLRGVLEHGKMGDKCLIAPDLVTAAIAALSAPPPAALRIVEPVLNRATPGTREAEMAVLETDENGVPTIWCDPEIADLVRALNVGGVRTVASCSGHGERLGSIALADGRALVICSSPDEAIAVIRSHEGQNPAAAGEEVRAWETEDGRVISARQKETALRDGGASASSVASYSIPLYTAPPSAPVGVEAIAAEIRASLGRGATVCTRRRWAIELEALSQQPAAVDRARFRKAPCYLCGYNGAGYFQPETHPCAALYHAAQPGGAE